MAITMKDYISREAAVKIADKYGCDNGSVLGHHSGVADCISSEIASLPAVEVRAVRHGYWREDAMNFSNGNYELECPFCECQMALNGCSKNQEYCPHCGEKLDFMRW